MKKSWLAVISLMIVIAIIGLVWLEINEPPPTPDEVLQSEGQKAISLNVNDAKPATLVCANSVFAFDLYQTLREVEGNLFYSPYSISLALAMTYVGAQGETARQMADTLHFAHLADCVHQAFNRLGTELACRGESAEGRDGEGFRLNIVNDIWGQEKSRFLSEFLNVLDENYGVKLKTLDFENAPEESRVTINDWISEQTEGRIKDLIPQGVINFLTRLILTNAIYFNAAWQHPFKEDATENGIFHLLDGGEVTVPMMRQAEWFGLVQGNGYQAVELLYDGGELSMVILLPQAGRFDEFEKALDARKVSEIIDRIELGQVELMMPRFEFDSRFTLGRTLAAMGMPDAFSARNANFSGMTGDRYLYIGSVVHKAFVSADEAGTEAAAATAVVIGIVAMPPPPAEVTIDRPFIFLIRDIETDTILFVGRVLNPAI